METGFITADILEYLKSVPDNSIDLGITSPPYNKQEKNDGGLVKKVIYSKYQDKMSESDYQSWQIKVLDELYRVMKPGGHFFYNHRVRYLDGFAIHPIEWLLKTKWRLRQEIIWNRKLAGNMRGWRFWPIEERIYWLYKPTDEFDKGQELESRHALLTSVWEIRPEMQNPHPAPFPIEIPTRIIHSIFGNQTGKLIIDPFSGSGTTALSAHLLGHEIIAVDLDEDYTKMAIDRVIANFDTYDLIIKELRRHRVKNRL